MNAGTCSGLLFPTLASFLPGNPRTRRAGCEAGFCSLSRGCEFPCSQQRWAGHGHVGVNSIQPSPSVARRTRADGV